MKNKERKLKHLNSKAKMIPKPSESPANSNPPEEWDPYKDKTEEESLQQIQALTALGKLARMKQ